MAPRQVPGPGARVREVGRAVSSAGHCLVREAQRSWLSGTRWARQAWHVASGPILGSWSHALCSGGPCRRGGSRPWCGRGQHLPSWQPEGRAGAGTGVASKHTLPRTLFNWIPPPSVHHLPHHHPSSPPASSEPPGPSHLQSPALDTAARGPAFSARALRDTQTQTLAGGVCENKQGPLGDPGDLRVWTKDETWWKVWVTFLTSGESVRCLMFPGSRRPKSWLQPRHDPSWWP